MRELEGHFAYGGPWKGQIRTVADGVTQIRIPVAGEPDRVHVYERGLEAGPGRFVYMYVGNIRRDWLAELDDLQRRKVEIGIEVAP